MKVSLNLVKKYVDLEGLSVEDIVRRLTFAGVEVESVSTLASGTNLTVGQVLTCENMPDSDHLHLTTVDTGSHGILHIVCGAPNVRKGLKVIVALDGAVLPGGTIHKGKVRGHDSEGMLCSLLELGVDAFKAAFEREARLFETAGEVLFVLLFQIFHFLLRRHDKAQHNKDAQGDDKEIDHSLQERAEGDHNAGIAHINTPGGERIRACFGKRIK